MIRGLLTHIFSPALAQIPSVTDVVKRIADFLDLSEKSRLVIQTLTGLDVFDHNSTHAQRLDTVVQGGQAGKLAGVAVFEKQVTAYKGPAAFCGGQSAGRLQPPTLNKLPDIETVVVGAVPELFPPTVSDVLKGLGLDYEPSKLRFPHTLNPKLEVSDADLISFPPRAEFLNEFFNGRYQIISELRAGGCARLYRVRDLKTQEERVIKVFNPSSEYESIVENELRFHEGEWGRFLDEGFYYMVIPYYEGGSILDFVDSMFKSGPRKSKPNPQSLLSDLLLGAVDSVMECHERGIVHNDISPDNIFPKVGRLLDMGLAMRAGENCLRQAGKTSYIAPELSYSVHIRQGKLRCFKRNPVNGQQEEILDHMPEYFFGFGGRFREELFQSKASKDGLYLFHPSFRSDQYSLGVTLMRTIIHVWVRMRSPEMKKNERMIDCFRRACADFSLHQKLSDCILKAMNPNPFDRYPNIASFKVDLMEAFDENRISGTHNRIGSVLPEESGLRDVTDEGQPDSIAG